MKWTVSFWRTAKMGQKAGRFYRIKNKEKTRRKYLIAWGHTVALVWVEKPQS